MPRIVKDCFGTVISSLKKMKECVRCELLAECHAINWTAGGPADGPQVVRRPDGPTGSDAAADPAGDPAAAGSSGGR